MDLLYSVSLCPLFLHNAYIARLCDKNTTVKAYYVGLRLKVLPQRLAMLCFLNSNLQKLTMPISHRLVKFKSLYT